MYFRDLPSLEHPYEVPDPHHDPALAQSRPLVSVVIPTRNRPELVVRAINSALQQTYTDLEVIVVIDGPDPSTTLALEAVPDPRLRPIALPDSVGGAEARNTGSRSARGQWVAFLDDDDEWLPEKIEKQLALAATVQSEYVFIASRYIERSDFGDRVLPTRSVDVPADFSEFLFCRERITAGTGYVQTSTWLVSKPLIDRVPFTKGLKRNQDVDWMLHATALPETVTRIHPESLAIFYEDRRPGRVSKKSDWQFHYGWAKANRKYFTGKAFSYFVSTICVEDARNQRAAVATFLKLFAAALFEGTLTPRAFLFFLYYCLPTERLRSARRMRLAGRTTC